jgi:hypothetical protein
MAPPSSLIIDSRMLLVLPPPPPNHRLRCLRCSRALATRAACSVEMWWSALGLPARAAATSVSAVQRRAAAPAVGRGGQHRLSLPSWLVAAVGG